MWIMPSKFRICYSNTHPDHAFVECQISPKKIAMIFQNCQGWESSCSKSQSKTHDSSHVFYIIQKFMICFDFQVRESLLQDVGGLTITVVGANHKHAPRFMEKLSGRVTKATHSINQIAKMYNKTEIQQNKILSCIMTTKTRSGTLKMKSQRPYSLQPF